MKIIVIFNLAEPQTIVFELVHLLHEDGFDVVIYDFTGCKKYNPVTRKISPMKSYWWAPFILQFRYVRGVFKPAINRRCIRQEFEKDTIVHIQYVNPSYLQYIEDIKKRGSKLVTTFWGSDYLRAGKNLKKAYESLLASSNLLACSRAVCNQIAQDSPGIVPKLRPVFFGIKFLKLINAVSSTDKDNFKEKYQIPAGKTIITLGYNAGEGQNHRHLIDLINQFDSAVKQTIHLLVPLTYGGTVASRDTIRQQLAETTGLTYTVFEKRLSVEEVALLRTVSHIVLNMQVTDAFSGAISESIEAGNIVIVGDWLPYDIYEEWDIFLLRIKKEDFSEKLKEVLANMDYWQPRAVANKGKIIGKLGWQATYPAWKALYTSLQNGQ